MMKKVLYFVVISIFLILGYGFHARYQAEQTFLKVSPGGIVKGLGIELAIPVSKGGIHGFFRPYWDLGDVTVQVKFFEGDQKQIEFIGAKAFVFPFQNDSVELFVKDLQWEQKKVSGLSLKLLPQGEISRVSVDQLFLPNSISVSKLVFSGESQFFQLAWKNVTWKEKEQSISFDDTQFKITKTEENHKLNWQIFSQGKGIKGQGKQTFEIRSWNLEKQISTQLAAPQELILFYRKILKTFYDKSESKPEFTQVWLDEYSQLIKKINPKLNRMTWHVDDVLVQKFGYDQSLELKNNEGVLNGTESQDGLKLDYRFNIQSLAYKKSKSITLELKNFSLLANYHLVQKSFFDFFSQTLIYRVNHSHSLGALFGEQIRSYPKTLDLDFTVASVAYQTEKTQADYEDFHLRWQIKDNEWILSQSVRVNQNMSEGPFKKLENVQFRFEMGLEFPWSKLSKQFNALESNNESQLTYPHLFKGEKIAFHLDTNLDSGSLNFKVNEAFDFSFMSDDVSLDWFDFKKNSLSNQYRSVIAHLISIAQSRLSLRIEKLSELQKNMDLVKPGSSLSLGLLAPYAKIDPEKDLFDMNIEMNKASIKVNGQPNPVMDQAVRAYLNSL